MTRPAPRSTLSPYSTLFRSAGLLLVQVPPEVGDKVAVLPTHTLAGAVTTGNAFTVTDEVVLLHPVDVCVKVNVTVPADTPVRSEECRVVKECGFRWSPYH